MTEASPHDDNNDDGDNTESSDRFRIEVLGVKFQSWLDKFSRTR